jgi:hypothetical protein
MARKHCFAVVAAVGLAGVAVACGAGGGSGSGGSPETDSGEDVRSDGTMDDTGQAETGSDAPSTPDHTVGDSGFPVDSAVAADTGEVADSGTADSGMALDSGLAAETGASDSGSHDAGREAGVTAWTCHPPRGYAAGAGPQSPIIADLTNDGSKDIAIVNRYDSTLGIYINNGGSAGTFQPEAIYNTAGGAGANAVAASDVNGDGWLDLGTSGPGALTVHLNRADGSGGMNGGTIFSYGLPDGGDGIAFGDFNGDHLPDFAGAVLDGNVVAVMLNQSGDAGVAFGPESDYAAGQEPDFVAIADLVGNHQLDLAVGNILSQNVSILFGQGDGTFVPNQTIVLGDAGTLNGPVLLADLDGDGAPDMVAGSSDVGDSGAPGFVVLLNKNDGSGTFGSPVSYAVPGGGGATAVYDMNGDGSLDVVGVVAGSASTYAHVFVMLNQNDGLATLGAPTLCAAGSYAYRAAAGDLNGDGKGDIVASNSNGTSAGTVQVILGH